MRDVKDRHGFQRGGVWLWVTREVHKGDVAGWQVPDHGVTGTHATNLAQFGDAVTIKVNPHIRLNVQDPLLHGIHTVTGAHGGAQRLACQVLVIAVQVGAGDVFLNLVLVIAHADQVRDSRHLAVGDDASIVK